MKCLPTVFLTLASLYICLAAPAQAATSPLPTPRCQLMLDAIAEAKDPGRETLVNNLLTFNDPGCLAELFVVENGLGFKDFVKYLESHRTDKQAGSSTGTGGTTNLVSKGTTARVLSVAAEYGALTESVNNQVVTIQGALDGVPVALIKGGLQYCPSKGTREPGPCISQGLLGILSLFSYGVSFNTSQNASAISGQASGPPRGTAQQATFTANQQQLASITGRVILWNQRQKATSSDFKSLWENSFKTSAKTQGENSTSTGSSKGPTPKNSCTFDQQVGSALVDSLTALVTPLMNNADFDDWQKQAKERLEIAKTKSDLYATWREQVESLMRALTTTKDGKPKTEVADLLQHARDFLAASSEYREAEDQLVKCIAEKPVLTFEYNNNRPANQTPNSTFRLIFDKGFAKNWSIAANGAFAIYDSQPSTSVPGAGRLRDAQAGIQIDYNLGSLPLLGAAGLSGAYYFQDQTSPAILSVTPSMPLPGVTLTGLPSTATQVFAKKGNISIAQVKLALGPGQSSVRFPIAVSYSNRTELITKPEWRGQVGISYDFDSLFTK
jgi:hypothetical protein